MIRKKIPDFPKNNLKSYLLYFWRAHSRLVIMIYFPNCKFIIVFIFKILGSFSTFISMSFFLELKNHIKYLSLYYVKLSISQVHFCWEECTQEVLYFLFSQNSFLKMTFVWLSIFFTRNYHKLQFCLNWWLHWINIIFILTCWMIAVDHWVKSFIEQMLHFLAFTP